jgi:hypothetical protein
MDSHAALFSALTTMVNADTGSGGLMNTADSNDAYLRGGFVRAGHEDEGRTHNRPRVEVEMFSSLGRTFGGRRDEEPVLVRFRVLTTRDALFTQQDAVVARLVAVFEHKVPADADSWEFSPGTFLRSFQGPSSGEELRYICEWQVVGTRSS